MKFKSEIVTQASGSIGGVTYSHNRGGLYRRARAIPTNPASAAQVDVRNNLSNLATRWREVLTQSQRDAWRTYAENTPLTDTFGDELILTGQQMYIRCNTPRGRGGLNYIDAGPTTFGQADLSALSLSSGAGVIDITYNATDTWANDSSGALLIQTSRFVAPTINFLRSRFRLQQALQGNSGGLIPPVSISESAFGGTIANNDGNRLFIRARATDPDGRLSPVWEGSVIAVLA